MFFKKYGFHFLKAQSAVIKKSAFKSSILSFKLSAEKPQKTTECTAHKRKQASIK